jgi:uncharacterized protein (DUF2126 family)
VFDLIDTWNGKAVGGCTYHVMHPGGRNSEHLPVNSYEAESRREARFDQWGHTPGSFTPPPWAAPMARFYEGGTPPGPMAPPEEEIPGEFPHTLDLRRASRY